MSESSGDDLLTLLQSVAVVTFRKIEDGSIRQMICTRNLELIPLSQWPKGLGGSYPPGLIKVYDLAFNDWRSFYDYTVLNARSYK